MAMTVVIEWLVWVLLLLFAANWTYGCYWKWGTPEGVTSASINTTFVWWFLLAWTLHYSSMNKLHLLWLALLAFYLSRYISPWMAGNRYVLGGVLTHRGMLPPGLITLLLIYVGVLVWLR